MYGMVMVELLPLAENQRTERSVIAAILVGEGRQMHSTCRLLSIKFEKLTQRERFCIRTMLLQIALVYDVERWGYHHVCASQSFMPRERNWEKNPGSIGGDDDALKNGNTVHFLRVLAKLQKYFAKMDFGYDDLKQFTERRVGHMYMAYMKRKSYQAALDEYAQSKSRKV